MATTNEGGLSDLFDLTFTKYVTPTVIRVVYILVIVFSLVWWAFIVIAGFSRDAGSGIAALILGGLGVLISLLVWRVILELTMVIFRIKENTDVMAGNAGGGGSPDAMG